MRAHHLNIGLVSTCLFLSVQALPKWLQPNHEAKKDVIGQRDYNIYETTTAIYGYTCGGYGPAPTVSRSTASSSLKTVSEVSEVTSSTVYSYSSSKKTLPTGESMVHPSVSSSTGLSTSKVVSPTDSTTAPRISGLPEETETDIGLRSSTAGSSSLEVSLTVSVLESLTTSTSSDIGHVPLTSTPAAKTGETKSSAVGITTSLHSTSSPTVYISKSLIATRPSETTSVYAEISGKKTSSVIGIATSLHSTPTLIVYETTSTRAMRSSGTSSGFVESSSPGMATETFLTSGHTTTSAIGITSSLKSLPTPTDYGTTFLSPSESSKTSSQSIETSIGASATETSSALGEITSSTIGIITSLQSSSKSTEYVMASPSPSKVSGTHSTKPAGSPTHGDVTSLSSSVFTADFPAPTPLKCNHNNCLRQIIRWSTLATDFCATYTTSTSVATTGLPDYISACRNSPSAISSACSCLGTSMHASFTKTCDVGTTTLPAGPLLSSASVSTKRVTKTIEITKTITTGRTTITTTSTLEISSSIIMQSSSSYPVVTAASSASLRFSSYSVSPSACPTLL